MPEKWTKAQDKRAAKKTELVAAHQERQGWKGNWEKQGKAHNRKASWDWRDQQHWKKRHGED